jgi:DNA-binding MarR family transcriptional regulator
MSGPSADLAAAIERDGRAFTAVYSASAHDGEPHVPATQLRVLETIAQQDCPVISALAATLEMSMPSVSRACDRLEASGWIERRPVDDDRRLTEVDLTQRGRDLLDRRRRQRCEDIHRIVAQMPPSQQRALRLGLAAFAAAEQASAPAHEQLSDERWFA